MTIRAISGRQILNGLGWPTIEVTVTTDSGVFRATAACSLSAGPFRAIDIYDEDVSQYLGRGVSTACRYVNEVVHYSTIGYEATDQLYLDKRLVESMDGSKHAFGWACSKIGRNVISAVSTAVARAGAHTRSIALPLYLAGLGEFPIVAARLPRPVITMIGGGLLGGSLCALESIGIIPKNVSSFRRAIEVAYEVQAALRVLLKDEFGTGALATSDAGGFSPPCESPERLMTLVKRAIEDSGHTDRCSMALDVAATTFHLQNTYFPNWKVTEPPKPIELNPRIPLQVPRTSTEVPMSAAQWRHRLQAWLLDYPIELLIDPIGLEEDHVQYYRALTEAHADRCTIAVHRILNTNPRLVSLFSDDIVNGIVIAPSDVASVSELLASARSAANGLVDIVVASGAWESEDSFLSDLSVAVGAKFVAIGGMQRQERVAKINQLLRIEEKLDKIVAFGDGDGDDDHMEEQ